MDKDTNAQADIAYHNKDMQKEYMEREEGVERPEFDPKAFNVKKFEREVR